jgi:activator of HSP90 ATPase
MDKAVAWVREESEMAEDLEVSALLPATAKRIYAAWLDGAEHGAFTGGAATCEPRVGGKFTAWDGYIAGTTVELAPFRRIVQTWRTTDFPAESPDSRLEVLLAEVDGGTRITLRHSGIPDGQEAGYRDGWEQYYFVPMREYFAQSLGGCIIR